MTFAELRDHTVSDCEQFSKMLLGVIEEIRAGDLKAFERFWIEGGTEEGDATIVDLRQRLVHRYLCREEEVARKKREPKKTE